MATGSPHAQETRSKVDPSVKSKKYRERLRGEVKELEALLPVDRSALGRKLDSQTVYRLVLAFFRANICFTALGFGGDKDDDKEGDSGDNRNDEDDKKEHRDVDSRRRWSHLDLAVEALEGFLLALTADGSVLYVSENIQSYLGFQQVDIMHRCFYSLVHPADHVTLRQTLEEASPPGGEAVTHPQQNEDDKNNATDTWRPLTFLCSMRCYHGNTSGYLKMQCSGRTRNLPGVASSRRTACQILVLFCQPFLLSSLQVSGGLRENSFWTKHGLDLALREVDAKVEVVLGYTSSELVGVSLYHLLHPEDLATCRYAHLAFAHSGDVRTVYLRLEAKGGNWVWLQCRGKVISKNGKKFSIVFSHCPIREEDSAYIQQEARYRRRYAFSDLQNQTFPGCHYPRSLHDVTMQGCLNPGEEATSPQPGPLGLSCPSSWHRPASPHSPLLPSSHSGHKISIKERQAHVKELRRHHQRQQQQHQLGQHQLGQQLQPPYPSTSPFHQTHAPWVAPMLQFPRSSLQQSEQACSAETMMLQNAGTLPNCPATPQSHYPASYSSSSSVPGSPWGVPKPQVPSTAGLCPQASLAQPSRPHFSSLAGAEGSWFSLSSSQDSSHGLGSLHHKSPTYLDNEPAYTPPATGPLPQTSAGPWGQQEWPGPLHQGTVGSRFHSPPPYGHSSNSKAFPTSFSRTSQASTSQREPSSPQQWVLSSPPPYGGQPQQRMFVQGNGDGLSRGSVFSAAEGMEVKVESTSSSPCTSNFQNSYGKTTGEAAVFCPKYVMASGSFTTITPPSARSTPFQDCFASNTQDARSSAWSQSREERLGCIQGVQQSTSPRTWSGFQPNVPSEGPDANAVATAPQSFSQNFHRNGDASSRNNQSHQWHDTNVNGPHTCPDANRGPMWQNYQAKLSNENTNDSAAQGPKAKRVCLETKDSGRTPGPGNVGVTEQQRAWRGDQQQFDARQAVSVTGVASSPWRALSHHPGMPEDGHVPNHVCSLSANSPHMTSNNIACQSHFHEQGNSDRQFCSGNQAPGGHVAGMQGGRRDAYGQPSPHVPQQSPFPAFPVTESRGLMELQPQLHPHDPHAVTPLPPIGGFLEMINGAEKCGPIIRY